ncbi:MAG: phenylpyruvate tautomerase MIF-related protein, partial [Clostridia bacterium]|nr:phenylpyruvate tautomerase MIF-related protein [Clostridia bacterium]
NLEDNCRLWFKGHRDGQTAYVEVSLFGSASDSQYERMTGAITEIIGSELSIPANRIYVKYEEASTWGWSGSNF